VSGFIFCAVVRGVGSAEFVAGTLLAGQAAGGDGLSAIIWLSATALLTTPIAASFVPAFPAKAARDKSSGEIPHRPWLTLLRQRAFVRGRNRADGLWILGHGALVHCRLPRHLELASRGTIAARHASR
jgi:hypothetical protein